MSNSRQSASPQSASSLDTSVCAPPDYAEMERALLATEHGAWFLAQYLERHRSEETTALLEAVTRLERSLGAAETACAQEAAAAASQESLKSDIIRMFDAFACTRKEIAQMKPPVGVNGLSPFTRYAFAEITSAMERATDSVIQAADRIQFAVNALRAAGAAEDHCAAMERYLADIHQGSAAHDHALQRNVKIVELLGHLESELIAVIESWELDQEEAGRGAEETQQEARSRLVEELALAILTDSQKQALFS